MSTHLLGLNLKHLIVRNTCVLLIYKWLQKLNRLRPWLQSRRFRWGWPPFHFQIPCHGLFSGFPQSRPSGDWKRDSCKLVLPFRKWWWVFLFHLRQVVVNLCSSYFIWLISSLVGGSWVFGIFQPECHTFLRLAGCRECFIVVGSGPLDGVHHLVQVGQPVVQGLDGHLHPLQGQAEVYQPLSTCMSLCAPGIQKSIHGANKKSQATAESDSLSSLSTAPPLEAVNSSDQSLGEEYDHCPQDETLHDLSHQGPVQDEAEAV